MALTKAKKDEVVAEISQLLNESKLTVVAEYKGTTVKAIQSLRKNIIITINVYSVNVQNNVLTYLLMH